MGLVGEQEEACIGKDSRAEPMLGKGMQGLGMGELRSCGNTQGIHDCGNTCETSV